MATGTNEDRPVEVDAEARLAKLPLKPGVALRAITIEAYANDVIFGKMGATIRKIGVGRTD
jgi:hypothetical protein